MRQLSVRAVLFGLLSACVADPEFTSEDTGSKLGSEEQQSPPTVDLQADGSTLTITGDPSTDITLASTCTASLTCNGIQAEVKWSMDGLFSGECYVKAPYPMPLVALIHGNGYAHTVYRYLTEHLAKNGFMVVSPNVQFGSYSQAGLSDDALEGIAFLRSTCFNNFLSGFSSSTPVDKHHLALIGHSRGGEIARWMAYHLRNASDFTTRAVVAMAPSYDGPVPLTGSMTEAYLVLVGTHDADTLPHQAYVAHDTSGYQEVTSSVDIYRSMKLLVNAAHFGFSDQTGPWASKQRLSTRGYVNALLHAHLLDDYSYYGDYIQDNTTPANSLSTFTQYSDTTRLVVDNAERDALSPGPLGSIVTSGFSSVGTSREYIELPTPHATDMLVLAPNVSGAYVRWNIPSSSGDLRWYQHLSVRFGQLSGATTTTSVEIGIKNGSSATVWKPLLAAGDVLPTPRPMCAVTAGDGICKIFEELAHMATFTVPLSSFGSVNNVTRIYLRFPSSNAIGKKFLLDNLEAAGTVFLQ